MNLFDYLLDPVKWPGPDGIGALLLQHLAYTGLSILVAALIAIPLGILIGHLGRGQTVVIGLSNAARSIPTLGFLIVVILLLGSGLLPVVIALTILAIPPILTATAAGIQGADREAVHAARALGMTGGQIVAKVEWPLALPLVISGLRSATLQVVATATVGGLTASGGLGQLIVSGQLQRDYPQMFAGALLVAIVAIVLEIALGVIGWATGRRTRPPRRTARLAVVIPS